MTARTPKEIGTDFVTAFGRGDLDAIRSMIADDIEFTSPRTHLSGATPYLAAVGEFAQVVDSVAIIAAFGSDAATMVLYDMHTAPFGTIRAVDYLTVTEERITNHQLVFDTYTVRKLTQSPAEES